MGNPFFRSREPFKVKVFIMEIVKVRVKVQIKIPGHRAKYEGVEGGEDEEEAAQQQQRRRRSSVRGCLL